MSVSKTYSKTCSAVGSFSYAGNFKLYVKLTDKDGSSSTNKSTVDYNVYCQADGSGSINAKHKLFFKINKKDIINETKTITASSPDAKFTIAKGSIEVTHKDDGSKSIDFEASVAASNYGVKASTSGSFTLEKIPRYFSKEPKAHKTGKTETTYTIEWSTSETCSKVVFYMGSHTKTWTGSAKTGSITMTGLTAGTTYKGTYIVCTRADSGLPSRSAPTDRVTTKYPYITAVRTSALVIGNSQTISLYNPLSRSVTIKMYQNSTRGTQLYSGSTTGTSITFTPNANTLYSSIPNSQSGNCVYSATYGITTTESGTYKIKGTEKPTIKDFSISSTEYQSLTGDPKRIILGYSNVTATPSSAATANNYAGSIKEYKTVIGNASAKSSSANAMTIANVTTNRVVMSVTDSRGLSSSKTVNGIAVNYSKILISSLSAKRNNNINPQSTLSFTISFWNQSFGAVQNSIKQIYYEYKKTSSSSWIKGGTTISSSNYTINGNKITGSLEIAGDLDAKGEGKTGFDINNSYNVRLYVQDALSKHTLSTILTTGLPAIAIYGNKVAIGSKYDPSLGNAMQVYGVIKSTKKDDFGAISKIRTVNSVDYTGVLGIGNVSNIGTVALELQQGGSVIGRADLMTGGVFRTNTFRFATNGEDYGIRNAENKLILADWDNDNVVINATGGHLFLGFQNTTNLNFMNGKASMSSAGVLHTAGDISCGNKTTNDDATTTGVYVGNYGAIQIARNGGTPYVGLYDVANGDQVLWSKLKGKNWCSNMSGYFNINYDTAQSIHRLYVNGSSYFSGAINVNQIQANTFNENLVYSPNNTTAYFGNGSSVSRVTTNLRGNTVRIYSHSSGAVYLGSSGSTAITSDENLKDIYEIDDKYIEFFNNLKPINYVYKDKGHRKHFGFGARQVEEALIRVGLTTEDFAGILIDKDVTICADENGTGKDIHYDELYSLRYEEFVSLNTLMIQKVLEEINKIKNKIGG